MKRPGREADDITHKGEILTQHRVSVLGENAEVNTRQTCQEHKDGDVSFQFEMDCTLQHKLLIKIGFLICFQPHLF